MIRTRRYEVSVEELSHIDDVIMKERQEGYILVKINDTMQGESLRPFSKDYPRYELIFMYELDRIK